MLFLFFLAIPAEFTQSLSAVEAKEGETITLTCEYSLPGVQFQWRKGFEMIRPTDRFVMKQRKTLISLTIKALRLEDSGEYICQCRDHHTTASLKVQGMFEMFFFQLYHNHWFLNECLSDIRLPDKENV